MTDGLDNFESDLKAAQMKSSKLPWVLFVLTLGVAGALGWFGSKMVEEARSKGDEATKKLDDAQKRAQAAESEKEELRKRLESVEGEKADLVAMKEDLSRDLKARDEELARLKGTYDKLNEKMKAEIKKGEIQLSQVGGKLRVDLIDKVLFDSGEAQISKKGEEVLSRVGQVLAGVDDKMIQVSGHTDDSPISEKLRATYPTNWELSVSRATNVVRYLQEQCKVNPKHLVAAGYSQYDAIATNANPSGRARNRRIEILLTPTLVEKPTQLAKGEAKGPPAKGKSSPPSKKPH